VRFNKVELLEWVKTQPKELIDLTNSGMESPEKLSDLGIRVDEIPLSGDNYYGYEPLKEHLANQYGITSSHIAITPGASMGNFAVLSVLSETIKNIIVEHPTYEPFIRIAETLTGSHSHRIKRYQVNKYHLDLNNCDLNHNNPVIVILSNLHNPTGIYETPETINYLADKIAKDNGWLLIDEVFHSFIKGGERASSAVSHERIITTNSLTKAWGLGSLRIGWVIGPENIVRHIERVMDNLHVDQPFMTEFIAYHILSSGLANELLEKARDRAQKNYQIVANYINGFSQLYHTKPDGGISVLIRFRDGRNADTFCEQLLKDHKTLVIPGRFFEVKDGFRLSFGMDPVMLMRGLEAVEKTLIST